MPLKGVYTAKNKKGEVYYRASVTYKNRHISLGSFKTQEMAHTAYMEGRKILENKDLTIGAMENGTGSVNTLSFHKAVCLINFRDNGLYIANPIYLYNKFFEYFLSPGRILKFDRDDLFYYSSHKIMERGGRLFVADYGMQVGINTRYGIKPYAVEGRDYCFVNGDNNDFRYENIKIINIYNGVEHVKKAGRTLFKARIHIRGNTVIGLYDTEIQAAIAYNKAIDCLSQKGVNKAYTRNYIAGLSSSEYLEIYNSLKIADYFAE